MQIYIEGLVGRYHGSVDMSAVAKYRELMIIGEALVKITCLGLLTGLDQEDRDRYALEYQLIRANDLKRWESAIDDLVSGPAAQHIAAEMTEHALTLGEISAEGSWITLVNDSIRIALNRFDTRYLPLRAPTRGMGWISDFTILRNKTRAHDALPPDWRSTVTSRFEAQGMFGLRG